ncbi:DUF881 domain-containing protein [Alkaliphilus crotonatoxidans]
MKKTYNQLILGTVFALLGFFITFQLIHMKDDYSFVSLKTINDLQNEITREKSEINNIKELIENHNSRLKDYQSAIENEGSISDVIKAEIETLKIIGGFTDLEGPGVTVKISDSERELYPWEEPKDLVVHEQDIITIINDLKFAGAEALSINGQRVMPHTEIKCSGPTITINNHTYGQPFIIKAIGDPATLEAALKSPDSHAYMIKEFYGVVIDTMVSPWVRIPRYQGDISTNFITPKEGE